MGFFYIKVGKKEIDVKIEITDIETIISSRFDPITHERTTNFIKNGTFYNNNIKDAGGIKICIGEEDGISLRLGFPEHNTNQSRYKP